MRYLVLAVALLVAPTLACCGEACSIRKGRSPSAERQILLNSLAIMLAIVDPGDRRDAWLRLVVPRLQPARATIGRTWTIPGQLELVVWAIPAHDRASCSAASPGSARTSSIRASRSPSTVKPVEVQVVSLDWKWLFIYPDQGVATVNQLVVPAGTPVSFQLTSSGVMNSFFVPQLGSQIYTMPGMTTRLNLQADQPGRYPGLSAQFSGEGFSDMHFMVHAVPPEQLCAVGGSTASSAGPALDAPAYAGSGQAERTVAPLTYRTVAPGLFDSIVETPPCSRPTPARRSDPPLTEGGTMMLGKLTWSAIPLDQPIPLARVGAVILVVVGVLALDHDQGLRGPICGASGSPRRPQAHRRDVLLLALVMLLRGFTDAIMMRSQQALAAGGAQGYLPPEHYDQIFSAHGTIMIFFVAMPFVIGLMNFVVPLQLGVRDVAFPTLNSVSFWLTASGALLVNISLLVGEFARTGWLAYPPLVGAANSRPASASTIISGRCRSPASAPCWPASISSPPS